MFQPTDPQTPKSPEKSEVPKIIELEIPNEPSFFYTVEEFYDPIRKTWYKRRISEI